MQHLALPRWQAVAAAPAAIITAATLRYARHAPERTLLYALVQAHYPDFLERLAQEDRALPEYVREAKSSTSSCAAAYSSTASCAWRASTAMRTNSPGANLNSRRLARRA